MTRTKVPPARRSLDTSSEASQVVSPSAQVDPSSSQQNDSGISAETRSDSTFQKKKPQSLAKKAGISFPPLKIKKKLRAGNYAKMIYLGGAIYMAAAIEYLVAEILDLAGDVAKNNKFKRIKPRHISHAVRNDEELNKLLNHVTISEGGVTPGIHEALLPKRTPLKLSKKKMEDSVAKAKAPKKSKKAGKSSKKEKESKA